MAHSVNDPLAIKVARRFVAARPMKPEKMTALLMKLRKGTFSSLKVEDLIQVWSYLGGWTIDATLVLVPDGHSGGPEFRYTNSHPSNVQMSWEQAKAEEVRSLPNPEHLKPYANVYMGVSEIEPQPSGQLEFTAKKWQVQKGVRVNAPNGKAWSCPKDPSLFEREYMTSPFLSDPDTGTTLLKWLQTDAHFIDQVNERLGLESYELERAKAKVPPRTREHTGTCPCCFRNIKLTPRARKGKDKSLPGMALHGYKRPGFGYTHSNCFGEDWPPFELSLEGSIAWVHELGDMLDQAEDRLKQLSDFEAVTILIDVVGREIKRGDVTPEKWLVLYRNSVQGQKGYIRSLGVQRDELRRRVSSWQLQPLPEADPLPER